MTDKEIYDRMHEVLAYDPSSGTFRWKLNGGSRRIGKVAGYVSPDGRVWLKVDYVRRPAHRVAWLMTYGQMPTHVIDHIDGNPTNNAIANLRDVPQQLNQHNQRRPSKRNTTGFLGVHVNKKTGRYMAAITVNKRAICLGTYGTAEEAHARYLAAKQVMHAGWIA